MAPKPITLRIQSAWPASFSLQDNLRFFAARVEALTDRSIKVEALSAGQIVPPFELLDATAKRVVDGSHSWAGYWFGKNSAAVLFGGPPTGPFGMDILDYLGWYYEAGGIALWREFLTDVLKVDIVPLPILPCGPQALAWFRKPIQSIADLKGLKCRFTGLGGEIWRRMGVSVVNLPGGEIIPAAERGVIDCAEWAGPHDDLKIGFPRIWKHYYIPGLLESTTVGELLINGAAWRELSATQQAAIESAASETALRFLAQFHRQNALALDTFKGNHGVEISPTPPEILKEIVRIWDEIVVEESAKNHFFKRVIDSQRDYARTVVPYRRVMNPPQGMLAKHYWAKE